MPLSWELISNPSVVCAIIHTEVTSIAWAEGFRKLIIPGPHQGPLLLAGMPYDHARNAACHHFLASGAEWLFFLDSDVIPPPDAVPRLLRHGHPLISGMYARRSPPHAIPVMLRGGVWLTEYPRGQVIPVDLVGAGCLLIHRMVLERLPPQRPGKHWFDWRVDMKGILPDGQCLSEDFTMCVHAKQHGFQVYVDTSVHCKHVGLAEAVHGGFGPVGSLRV